MARTALIEKCEKESKYEVREYNRCENCGRSGSYMRDFGVCRHCFREMAHNGQIPGVRKASW